MDELVNGLIEQLEINRQLGKDQTAKRALKFAQKQFVKQQKEFNCPLPDVQLILPNACIPVTVANVANEFKLLSYRDGVRDDIEGLFYDALLKRFGGVKKEVELFVHQALGDQKDNTKNLPKDVRALILKQLDYTTILTLS